MATQRSAWSMLNEKPAQGWGTGPVDAQRSQPMSAFQPVKMPAQRPVAPTIVFAKKRGGFYHIRIK